MICRSPSKRAALNISRGSIYYLPRAVPEADLAIMRRLDRLHVEFPFAGSRMLRGLLTAEGCKIGRRHVKTLMKRMGIEALYRRPRTTKPAPGHKIYPYLLRGIEITRCPSSKILRHRAAQIKGGSGSFC
jgi:putative transposase